MSFAHAGWLWALALLPVLALLEWRGLRRAERALKLLAGARPNAALLAQRAPGSRRAGLLLRLGALALLALGAAGPEWGREAVRRSSSGSDLVFVLDVSASMDTRDVPPSRLDEARREALGLLDRVAGCRVGVVAFAGDAVRLSPLTLDQAAVRLTLEALTRDAVSTPGTDLGRALRTALALLPPGHRADQAIVLWTDGEDLEGRGQGAIADLQRAGVRVFAVGVGTPAGDVIPVLDDQGRTVDVKRDEQGTPVRSRLDEPLLRELARGTRGGYFPAARPGGQLAQLTAALGGLARSLHGARLVERPIARFTLCALLAAALLAFDLARARRRLPAAAAR
ncbi:MAG TPA: VWA domain-containing protein, partial [Candidatus Eisenbacteria bacterium]|nr:VWA domain-containing protein [Candidatus Eisenbacteria bacterium]